MNFAALNFSNAQTIGALSAGMSVLLGAFGSHGLKSYLAPFPKEDQQYYLDIWNKAATYQMYHSIGMILSPMVAKTPFPNSAKMFLSGIGFFSGSLYTLVLSQKKWMGAITPIGGIFMACGWLAMAMKQ